jgi:hypothetical protein
MSRLPLLPRSAPRLQSAKDLAAIKGVGKSSLAKITEVPPPACRLPATCLRLPAHRPSRALWCCLLKPANAARCLCPASSPRALAFSTVVSSIVSIYNSSFPAELLWSHLSPSAASLPPCLPAPQFLETGTLAALAEAGIEGGVAPVNKAAEVAMKFL